MERFQPMLGRRRRAAARAARSRFAEARLRGRADGEQPILVAGEEAGPSCRSAAAWASATPASAAALRAQVRDLRTGEVHGQAGEMVRTCINAPEGAVEIEL